MQLRVLSAVVAFLLSGAPAFADPITFAFSGAIEFASGDLWALGDPVYGYYRFESSTPGVVPTDGIGVRYSAINGFAVLAGSRTIAGSSGTISVHFNEPALGGESGYDVKMSHGSTGSSSWDVYLSGFDALGFGSLVTNESIQTTPPPLAFATSAGGTILGSGGEYGFSLSQLNRVPVPEPPALWLVGFGAVSVAALRISSVLRPGSRRHREKP